MLAVFFAVMVLVAAWRFLPCPSCCGCACSHCSGATPQTLQVVMTGWQNPEGGCQDCLGLNATFLVNCSTQQGQYYYGPFPLYDCSQPSADPRCCGSEWRYNLMYVCGYRYLMVRLLYTASGYAPFSIPAGHYFAVVEVGVDEENNACFFLDLGTEKPDCSDINWQGWTLGFGLYPCEGSAIAIRVTVP